MGLVLLTFRFVTSMLQTSSLPSNQNKLCRGYPNSCSTQYRSMCPCNYERTASRHSCSRTRSSSAQHWAIYRDKILDGLFVFLLSSWSRDPLCWSMTYHNKILVCIFANRRAVRLTCSPTRDSDHNLIQSLKNTCNSDYMHGKKYFPINFYPWPKTGQFNLDPWKVSY